MIYYGAGSFSPNSINYSRTILSSKNSYNENLHLQDDGYNLYLVPSVMSIFSRGRSKENEQLTNEGAAEYFWEMFIEPLQRNG